MRFGSFENYKKWKWIHKGWSRRLAMWFWIFHLKFEFRFHGGASSEMSVIEQSLLSLSWTLLLMKWRWLQETFFKIKTLIFLITWSSQFVNRYQSFFIIKRFFFLQIFFLWIKSDNISRTKKVELRVFFSSLVWDSRSKKQSFGKDYNNSFKICQRW